MALGKIFNRKKVTFHDTLNPNILYLNSSIEVRRSDIGFGIYAKEKIFKDEILEECHYLKYQSKNCNSVVLNDYVFGVAESEEDMTKRSNQICKENALALGYGSIYNHSENNNADYYLDNVKNVYVFYTLKNIKKNEQICISYGKNWWTSRDIQPKKIITK